MRPDEPRTVQVHAVNPVMYHATLHEWTSNTRQLSRATMTSAFSMAWQTPAICILNYSNHLTATGVAERLGRPQKYGAPRLVPNKLS